MEIASYIQIKGHRMSGTEKDTVFGEIARADAKKKLRCYLVIYIRVDAA